MENNGKTLTVVKTEKENHDITSLYLKGHSTSLDNRKAGQYLSIRLPEEDKWTSPHPFTMSSAPEDETIRLTIKKAGAFTSSIPDLKTGTPVKFSGPHGHFCRNIDNKENIAMSAGGVGVTPFLSVLRHFKNTNAKNRITLFWTSRTIDDAFSLKELEEMTGMLDLTVIHTLSRDKEAARFAREDLPRIHYVSGYATREVIQEFLDVSNTAFFVCGPPRMQEFVLDELQALGVARDIIEIESFAFNPG